MNARPYTTRDWVKLVLSLAGFLAVIFLSALLVAEKHPLSQSALTSVSSATPTPTPIRTTSFYDANRVPAIGQQGRVRIDVPFTFGATSEANFGAMVKATQAGDKAGIAELALQRRIYDVDNGTKVLVIDRRNELSQVRILDGIDAGRTAWLLTRFLDY